MKPFVRVKRCPYEEPYCLQIEIIFSNGDFSGATDIYCGPEDLKDIGRAFSLFPQRVDDEYCFEYGSDDPKVNIYRHFVLKSYTVDSVGHGAIQFIINNNSADP